MHLSTLTSKSVHTQPPPAEAHRHRLTTQRGRQPSTTIYGRMPSAWRPENSGNDISVRQTGHPGLKVRGNGGPDRMGSRLLVMQGFACLRGIAQLQLAFHLYSLLFQWTHAHLFLITSSLTVVHPSEPR